jgi:VanZ family protein
MRLIKDHRLYRFLSIGWMVLIFWLSSRPELPVPMLFWGQDKLGHALVFGILAFLYARSFRPREENPSFARVLLITLMVAAYGMFDEVHQMFIPGRDASIADLAADTAGGFFSAVIFYNKRF